MRSDIKISFIVCTNDPLFMAECEKYLRRLIVPEGCAISVIPVIGAVSMCSGYNQGMRRSDADIKIYLHQDVMIINKHFLENILMLFASHPEAGMIGMVGSQQLSGIGVMWRGSRNEIGALYKPTDEEMIQEKISSDWPVAYAECIDGFLMVTREDILWREDLFDGWDFYDVSQSFEYQRRGLRILIPEQTNPWCLHDDGRILSLYRYDHYRNIFLNEYGSEIERYSIVPMKNDDYIGIKSNRQTEEEYISLLKALSAAAGDIQSETERIFRAVDTALLSDDPAAFLELSEEFSTDIGRKALVHSTDLLRVKQMIESVRMERQAGAVTFIDGVKSNKEFRDKYLRCTFAMREIEMDQSDTGRDAALQYLRDINLSAFSAAAILYNMISLLGHREKILVTLAEDALGHADIQGAWRYLHAVQQPSKDVLELREEMRNLLG